MKKGDQTVNNFIKTLSKLGVAFEGENVTGSSVEIRKSVAAGLRRDPVLLQQFERELQACIECDEGLAFALSGHARGGTQLEASNHGRSQLSASTGLSSSSLSGSYHQSSFIKILLGIDQVQPKLVDCLVDRVVDFVLVPSEDNLNKARRIMNQFRWMDNIVDCDRLCKKFLELLGSCPNALKKEIILFLPDILVDSNHDIVVPELLALMHSDKSFTVPVLDAVSSLSLRPELLSEVCDTALSLLSSATPDDLPVLLKFVIQSVNATNLETIIKVIRDKLRPETFQQQQMQGANNSTQSDHELLILEVLRSGIRSNKLFCKQLLETITKLKNPADHKVLDLWFLYIIHGLSADAKKKMEILFKKKVVAKEIKKDLLVKSLTGHATVLTELFDSVQSLLSALVRAGSPECCDSGRAMYIACFCVLNDVSYKQELLGSLLSHIGSGNNEAINCALGTLQELTQQNFEKIKPLAATLQSSGILDYSETSSLTFEQIRIIYAIFTDLAAQRGGVGANELEITISKQLNHPGQKSRMIGVIGSLTMMSALCTNHYSRPKEDFAAEALKKVKHMVDVLLKCGEKEKSLQSYIYDAIANCVQKSDLRVEVLTFLNEKSEDIIQERFLCDTEKDASADEGREFKYALEENAEIYVDFIGQANPLDKDDLRSLPSLFRLLQACCRGVNEDSLESIGVLLSCPYCLFTLSTEFFNSLNTSDRETVCNVLLGASNWTIELLNAFSTQTSNVDMQDKVLRRLHTLLELETSLNYYLSFSPMTVASKKSATSPDTNKKPSASSSGKFEPLPHLTRMESDFRVLDVSVLTVLSSKDVLQSRDFDIKILFLLFQELERKSRHLLVTKSFGLGLIKKNVEQPAWMTTFADRPSCVRYMQHVFGSLPAHMKRIVTEMMQPKETQTPQQESDLRARPIEDAAYRLPSLYLILKCCNMLFKYEPLYQQESEELLRVILSDMIRSDANDNIPVGDLLYKTFILFEGICEDMIDFKAYVLLVEILVTLLNKQKQVPYTNDCRSRLSSLCKKALRKNWNEKIMSAAIKLLMQNYIAKAPSPLKEITSLTAVLSKHSSEDMVVENDERWCALSDSTFPYFYRELLIELSRVLTGMKLAKEKKKAMIADPDGIFQQLLHCVQCFSELIHLTKSHPEKGTVLGAIKFGQTFLDSIVQSFDFLTAQFSAWQKQEIEIFKKLQVGTKHLHALCAHVKAEKKKNVAAMKEVPKMKKTLEEFVFQVKLLLNANGLSEAFWLGHLRHKSISGEEISSQVTPLFSKDEDQSSDSDSEDSVKEKKKKKSTKAKKAKEKESEKDKKSKAKKGKEKEKAKAKKASKKDEKTKKSAKKSKEKEKESEKESKKRKKTKESEKAQKPAKEKTPVKKKSTADTPAKKSSAATTNTNSNHNNNNHSSTSGRPLVPKQEDESDRSREPVRERDEVSDVYDDEESAGRSDGGPLDLADQLFNESREDELPQSESEGDERSSSGSKRGNSAAIVIGEKTQSYRESMTMSRTSQLQISLSSGSDESDSFSSSGDDVLEVVRSQKTPSKASTHSVSFSFSESEGDMDEDEEENSDEEDSEVESRRSKKSSKKKGSKGDSSEEDSNPRDKKRRKQK